MIALARVDDRLVHGQVTAGWVPHLRATVVVVANDRIAADPLLSGIVKASTAGVPVEVLTVADAGRRGAAGAWEREAALLLFESLQDACRALDAGLPVTRLNLGGLRHDEGRLCLCDGVTLDGDDCDARAAALPPRGERRRPPHALGAGLPPAARAGGLRVVSPAGATGAAGTSLLLGALGLDQTAAAQVLLSQPLVGGAILGWAAGDPAAGLLAGSYFQFLCLTELPVGASVPPDTTLAGLIGAAAFVSLGHPAGWGDQALLGLLTAGFLPLAFAGRALDIRVRRWNRVWGPLAERLVVRGSHRLAQLAAVGGSVALLPARRSAVAAGAARRRGLGRRRARARRRRGPRVRPVGAVRASGRPRRPRRPAPAAGVGGDPRCRRRGGSPLCGRGGLRGARCGVREAWAIFLRGLLVQSSWSFERMQGPGLFLMTWPALRRRHAGDDAALALGGRPEPAVFQHAPLLRGAGRRHRSQGGGGWHAGAGRRSGAHADVGARGDRGHVLLGPPAAAGGARRAAAGARRSLVGAARAARGLQRPAPGGARPGGWSRGWCGDAASSQTLQRLPLTRAVPGLGVALAAAAGFLAGLSRRPPRLGAAARASPAASAAAAAALFALLVALFSRGPAAAAAPGGRGRRRGRRRASSPW